MLIPVFNPETDDLEKSFLLNPHSVGVTSIKVKNSDRFFVDDRIMLGKMGQEATEVVTVSAVNADEQTLTIGATIFAHSADDPVYVLRFDQVKFYRSTTTSDGVYSVISTEDLDVDNADLQTKFDDTTGTASNFYKFTFFHSTSGTESAFSDVIGGSGWRRDQFGYIIDEVLREVGDEGENIISRTELLGYFNDVNDDLLIDVSKPYSFLHSRTTLTRTANTNHIDFPTDSNGRETMWKFDRLDYEFTDDDTTPVTDETKTIRVLPMDEFRNTYTDNTISSTTVTDAKPAAMALDTAVKRFRFSHPFETTAGNVFYLYYWKYFTTIDSEGDSIETPTPKIYKLYCKANYYKKRAITEPSYRDSANSYMADYLVERGKYKSVDRKDAGSPRSFRPQTSVIKEFRR
jgi:hypothetical protein